MGRVSNRLRPNTSARGVRALTARRHGWRRFSVFRSTCMVSHSAAMARPISSGVLLIVSQCRSRSGAVADRDPSGWMKMSRILATSAGGMPAGPPSANQLATRSLVKPSSTKVGTSGSGAQRASASSASARSFLFGEIGARRRQGWPGHVDAAGDQIGHHRRAAAIVHGFRTALCRRAGSWEPSRCDGEPNPGVPTVKPPVSCGPSRAIRPSSWPRLVRRHGEHHDAVE